MYVCTNGINFESIEVIGVGVSRTSQITFDSLCACVQHMAFFPSYFVSNGKYSHTNTNPYTIRYNNFNVNLEWVNDVYIYVYKIHTQKCEAIDVETENIILLYSNTLYLCTHRDN